MSFEINPNNYLGQNYSDHTSKCLSLALSDPKTFYNARAQVIKNLKRDVVKDFYDNIFKVLSTGNTSKGASVYGSVISPNEYPVDYPKQKINEIALSFAATIDKMMEYIAAIILPDKLQRAVEDKLGAMGKASVL